MNGLNNRPGRTTVPVTNIIRGSPVDGPGLRTVIFLKGCPLCCPWCHNPETQQKEPELLYDARRCIRCGACATICGNGAIDMTRDYVIDREKCIGCFSCTDACPSTALTPAGKALSADELMVEILKDRAFYRSSGGGVTFSGGEPLLYPAFLRDAAARCITQGIDTCIDTSLAVPRAAVEEIVDVPLLFLVDVKHASRPETLPDLVFSNLDLLCGKARIWIRIPVIPAWNDSTEEMAAIVARLAPFADHIGQVGLLPFHHTAAMKYRYLNRKWQAYEDQALVDDSRMEQYRVLFQKEKFTVTFGG